MANSCAILPARSLSRSAMPMISMKGRLRRARAWYALTYPAPTRPTRVLRLGSIVLGPELPGDPFRRFGDGAYGDVGLRGGTALAVAAIDADGAAAGGGAGVDIAPAVADHETLD